MALAKKDDQKWEHPAEANDNRRKEKNAHVNICEENTKRRYIHERKEEDDIHHPLTLIYIFM